LLNLMEKIHLVDKEKKRKEKKRKEKNSRNARVSLVKLTFNGRDVYRYAFLSGKHAMDSSTADLGSKQLTAVLNLPNKLQ
jgi:hypothetical protein